MEVLQSLQTLETVNQALFAHTAESKAQAKLNNWWIVHLSFWDKAKDGQLVDFFPGENYDEKMTQWDIFEEEKEPYAVEALARFALLIGLWNAGAQTKEDFAQGERDYGGITTEAIESMSGPGNEVKETPVEEPQKIEPAPEAEPSPANVTSH